MRNPKQEARRWLQQAQSDFAFLDVARQAHKYDTCGFLAQQTAEKALKAYLFHQGEELVFTHSFFRLCDLAAQYDPAFRDIREQVKLLDFYYVEAR
jgi:HEPN domain-containing protein